VSQDIDAIWDVRSLILPDELRAFSYTENGDVRFVHLDQNFSDTIGLFHPDWKCDAHGLLSIGCIDVYIMTAIDLAVSKIGRWQDRDQEDIAALSLQGLLDPEEIKQRAQEALSYAVGNMKMISINLEEALDVIRLNMQRQNDGASSLSP
jgi:hypothetical protein